MKILILFFFFMVTACHQKLFQPPKDVAVLVYNQNLSTLEARKVMLECGYASPYSATDYTKTNTPENNSFNLNALILSSRCLENEGFHYGEDRVLSISVALGYCNDTRRVNYPACAHDAVIPVRSIEKRLNSPYCKEFPKNQLCQSDPSALYSLPQASSSITQQKPVEPFDSKLNRQMQEQQFQQQVQQQSNSQMSDLLKNTTPKK